MRRLHAPVAAVLAIALLAPSAAQAHPERTTAFAFPAQGKVPVYRTTGPSNVVCKKASRKLLKKQFKHQRRTLKKRLRTLAHCRFHDIQPAIDKAKSGYRILIMPGVYKEPASRKVPVGSPGNPPCADDYVDRRGLSLGAAAAGPRVQRPARRARTATTRSSARTPRT